MKIVLNRNYRGFHVSKEFCDYYNIPYDDWGTIIFPKETISHTDKRLIEYIEKFGSKQASGTTSVLDIIEIPRGTKFRIRENNGYEWIEKFDDDDWEVAE